MWVLQGRAVVLAPMSPWKTTRSVPVSRQRTQLQVLNYDWSNKPQNCFQVTESISKMPWKLSPIHMDYYSHCRSNHKGYTWHILLSNHICLAYCSIPTIAKSTKMISLSNSDMIHIVFKLTIHTQRNHKILYYGKLEINSTLHINQYPKKHCQEKVSN